MRPFPLIAACVLAAGSFVVPPASADDIPAVSANPVDWTPHITDGNVQAYAVVGSKIIVGGTFTGVKRAGTNEVIPRRNIYAYDLGTGQIDMSFVPKVDGTVDSLATGGDGATVFVGGYFANVNGSANRGLVKLRTADGSRVSEFSAKINTGRVKQLVRRGTRLYVGGSFSAIKGVARTALARVDALTGMVDSAFDFTLSDSRQGPLRVVGMAVDPADTTVVVDGTFTRVNGKSRSQIAMMSTSGTLRTWATDRFGSGCGGTTWDSYMRDIDFSPDGSYFVVVTTGGWHKRVYMCDSASRWEARRDGSGQQPTWVNYTGSDSLYAVAVTSSAVYVGGHQRWLDNPDGRNTPGPGAVSRRGLGALHPVTGKALAWNPGRDPLGHGTEIIVADRQAGLLTGSDTDGCGGEWHQKICAFPVAAG